MATEENKPTERVVLIAVDGSQNSEKAFECKFNILLCNMYNQTESLIYWNLGIGYLEEVLVSRWRWA